MPLSKCAWEAVQMAAQLNPDGARALVAILRTAPRVVRHKPPDRFGPLGMMVSDREQSPGARAEGFPNFQRPSLPAKFHQRAEEFHKEWIARRFTKAELANALEDCLRQLGEELPTRSGGWLSIRPESDRNPDPLKSVFSADLR